MVHIMAAYRSASKTVFIMLGFWALQTSTLTQHSTEDAVMYLDCVLPTMDPKSTESCKLRQIYTKTEVRRSIVEATAGFPIFPLIVTYSYM